MHIFHISKLQICQKFTFPFITPILKPYFHLKKELHKNKIHQQRLQRADFRSWTLKTFLEYLKFYVVIYWRRFSPKSCLTSYVLRASCFRLLIKKRILSIYIVFVQVWFATSKKELDLYSQMLTIWHLEDSSNDIRLLRFKKMRKYSFSHPHEKWDRSSVMKDRKTWMKQN